MSCGHLRVEFASHELDEVVVLDGDGAVRLALYRHCPQTHNTTQHAGRPETAEWGLWLTALADAAAALLQVHNLQQQQLHRAPGVWDAADPGLLGCALDVEPVHTANLTTQQPAER